MAYQTRSFIATVAFTLALLGGLPVNSSAQGGNSHGVWLAASSPSASQEVVWGRLTLKDSMLVFSAPNLSWQLPVSEIKRVSELKGIRREFAVETVTGGVMHFSILGQQMLPQSPRKVIQVIERAVRETPAPRPTVAVAAGGGSF